MFVGLQTSIFGGVGHFKQLTHHPNPHKYIYKLTGFRNWTKLKEFPVCCIYCSLFLSLHSSVFAKV